MERGITTGDKPSVQIYHKKKRNFVFGVIYPNEKRIRVDAHDDLSNYEAVKIAEYGSEGEFYPEMNGRSFVYDKTYRFELS